MDNLFLSEIRKMLIQDEGVRLHLYKDHLGNFSIGIGRNLSGRGISMDEAIYLVDNDIQESIKNAQIVIKNWNNLTKNKQFVIINMIFNLGLPRFLTFKKMIGGILEDNNEIVCKEMMQSEWASQVGDRAKRLCKLWMEG